MVVKDSTKLTPLEKQVGGGEGEKNSYHQDPKWAPNSRQVLDLKRRHPHLVLFVECGYRYRFFGQDAEIAARWSLVFFFFFFPIFTQTGYETAKELFCSLSLFYAHLQVFKQSLFLCHFPSCLLFFLFRREVGKLMVVSFIFFYF